MVCILRSSIERQRRGCLTQSEHIVEPLVASVGGNKDKGIRERR
jgi:hypothetical protein